MSLIYKFFNSDSKGANLVERSQDKMYFQTQLKIFVLEILILPNHSAVFVDVREDQIKWKPS